MEISKNKVNNIKIQPLNNKKIIPRTIQQPLPDPITDQPFVFIISSKIGSGKSVTLSNILKIYSNYFLRVYFCSSNIDIDEKTNQKVIKDLAYENQFEFNQNRMYNEFNDDILDDILQDIKQVSKEEDYDEIYDHFLIVVDDLSQAFLKTKSLISKTILKTRHIKLSWIIVTQRFRNIAPVIRGQAMYFMTFLTQNNKELEAMSEMVDLSFDEFKLLVNNVCNERFQFLFVDLSKNPPDFYRNFNEKLTIIKSNK